MKIHYQILFSIEVLNNYFSHQKWKDIEFIPFPETSRLLKQSGLQLRRADNQLLVIAPVNESGKPRSLPDAPARFSFALKPQTPNYINFTNLPGNGSGVPLFRFHNLHATSGPGVNYLTSEIDDYSSGLYHPGTYVKAGDGKIYESIRINNNVQAPNDSNAASKDFWVLQGDVHFVTVNDTLQAEGGVRYTVKQSSPIVNVKTSAKSTYHSIKVFGYSFATGGYDQLLMTDKALGDAPFDLVQVDLRRFESGLYKVVVNSDVFFVYTLTPGAAEATDFVIDIFHLAPSDPRALVNADGTLKKTKYTIRFGSRRVFWKYKTRTNAINKIEDSSGDYKFKADGLRQFISEKPIPLSDAPRKTLSANTGTLIVTSPLPNPRVDRLLDKRDEIFTTETFINY